MDRPGGRCGGTAIDDGDVVSGGQQPGNQSLSEIAVSANDTYLAHGVPPPRTSRTHRASVVTILSAYASRLKGETWEIRPPHRRNHGNRAAPPTKRRWPSTRWTGRSWNCCRATAGSSSASSAGASG